MKPDSSCVLDLPVSISRSTGAVRGGKRRGGVGGGVGGVLEVVIYRTDAGIWVSPVDIIDAVSVVMGFVSGLYAIVYLDENCLMGRTILKTNLFNLDLGFGVDAATVLDI
jgi:hypothetical protein